MWICSMPNSPRLLAGLRAARLCGLAPPACASPALVARRGPDAPEPAAPSPKAISTAYGCRRTGRRRWTHGYAVRKSKNAA